MKGFIKALILLPLTLVLVLLAVANRAPVRVGFDPFTPDTPLYSVTLPLWALLFGLLVAGVIIGGVATWIAQAHNRREKRVYRREAQSLRREVETRREPPARGTAVAASGPALPAPRA